MRGGAVGAEMRGGRRPAGLACFFEDAMPGGLRGGSLFPLVRLLPHGHLQIPRKLLYYPCQKGGRRCAAKARAGKESA